MIRTILANLLFAAPLLMMQIGSVPSCNADDLPPAVDREVDFGKEIQPILQKHCWSCHGGEKKESGLQLDRRDAAMLGGDSGKVLVPGNSKESKLIRYVAGLDPDHLMPPKDEGSRLSSEEISLLRAWIDRGARWPDSLSVPSVGKSHWAYQPLRRDPLPNTKNQAWGVNPIDRFVLAKLEENNLSPSKEADRPTLIRRLYLDLHGLLPSIEEVDRFIQNTNSNAYETLVDRLLDSPHFGERWGRHWLDMARYADSDGYEKDNPRPDAYRWRDWVIDSINKDLPFDQFTIEQLAGDLLPNASAMQKLATAFHRQTLTNTEGGTDQEQFRVEACFDRTETTGAVWLGLTVGCARCHTHKYDAISQREYYQLFAFHNNGDEKTETVPKSPEEIEAYRVAKEAHDLEVVKATAKLRDEQAKLGDPLDKWEVEAKQALAKMAEHPLKQDLLKDVEVTSDGEVTFKLQKDGSYLASGKSPDKAIYTIQGTTSGTAFDTIRLDILSDKSLPAKGPGRVKHGNFVLSEITIEVSESKDFTSSRKLEFESAKADHEQPGTRSFLAKHAIDGKEDTGWAIAPQFGKDHWAEFRLKEPIQESKPMFVRFHLSQQHGEEHTLGRFKIALQSGQTPEIDIPEKVAKVLSNASAERSDADRAELLDHFSRSAPSTKKLIEKLDALKKKEPPKPEIAVRVLAQRMKDQRKTLVLRRGEFLEPLVDGEVQPGGLATLHPFKSREESRGGDRLDLAIWLVSKENPLTPRVTVNHFWRLLFGTGIVKTANDFGVRGDPPTHPELLDWLAGEFVGSQEKAWSRKSLIKLILMSATYRQSSQQRSELLELDPQNRLLGRQNRLRVEAEIVRDISLDVSGLLSRKIGGPSVYPALPPGVAELSYAGNFKWTLSDGADRYRRGMYTFFKRTSPHPNLITFDCPDANLACVDRNKSNTPLQALVALNNESFAESARSLAKRILTTTTIDGDAPRLEQAFRWCLARSPKEHELNELTSLLNVSRRWYGEHPEQAKKLVDAYSVSGVPPEENAAWIATARILTNLDEFITRE